MKKKRPLTEEEKRLWQLVTKDDKPLHVTDDGRRITEDGEAIVAPTPLVKQPSSISRQPPAKMPMPAQGAYANIDRNTADKFRKGEMQIEATLDLHGMNREKAQRALGGFLETQFTRGSRCLLVVTGKGVRKNVSDEPERGILREMFPRWLEEFSSIVLAFDVAKPKHGGSGAYYVLLRRKR